MIEVQNIDFTGYNRGMIGLVQKAGLSARTVVKTESGRLVETLVKVTPKANAKKIQTQISNKFDQTRLPVNSDLEKTSPSGMRWFSVNSKFLSGIAPKDDKRSASVEDLKLLSYRITKKGRLNLPFRKPRAQRVLLLKQILTKESTVKKLIAKKKQNRGRLAASWLVGVVKGEISVKGIPAFVSRHQSGAKGRTVNDLNVEGNPSYTIANACSGIGNPKNRMGFFVQLAVKARAAAMVGNLKKYLEGKKNLLDYAR